MEFILRLPQEIDKDGALWQIWNSFCQKLKCYQKTDLHGTALTDASSLLLFAAHDQISSICSSLKMYDLDLPKLNQILQVVEQACLPYFILLFERFRYFSLKRELSDSLDDYVIVLRKQAEVCEFGNLKDSIMTNALHSSVKNESLVQRSSNTDGLHFDNINASYSRAERSQTNVSDINASYSRAERSQTNVSDINASNAEVMSSGGRIMTENGLGIFSQLSAGKHNSKDRDISCPKLIACTDDADHSVFYCEKGSHNISHSTDKKKVVKFREKLSNWKTAKRAKHMRVEKYNNLEDKEPSAAITFEKSKRDDIFSTLYNETDADWNVKLSSALMTTKQTEPNLIALTKFHCCFCDKAFAGQNCLRKHFVLKHKGCTKFSCKMCSTTFLGVDEYLLHYKNEHFVQQKPQPRTVPSLKLRVKRNIGRFNCTLCRRVFVKEGYLRRHIHYSHAKSFLCWNCGENCQSLSEYKQHGEKHAVVGRFSCDLCQRQHHNIFRLVGHLKNHLMPHNKCEICGVVFIKQESLAKHIEKHVDEPVHKCKICGKNFVIEARLQYHMRTHSGEKRFTCELCGKMYAQKINLVHHKRWHAGEQPFECEICGKRTRSSGDLSKHKRKHSDKYSYVCEVCGRGFNYSSALVKHRMGHTGKRSYACDVCGRTFIYREGLRDHIKASRCPGRRSESSYNRTPRATKLLQSGISNNLMDVESKIFGPTHSQRAPDTSLKDIQDWHCMLRNNEADGGTSVVLVPSFY